MLPSQARSLGRCTGCGGRGGSCRWQHRIVRIDDGGGGAGGVSGVCSGVGGNAVGAGIGVCGGARGGRTQGFPFRKSVAGFVSRCRVHAGGCLGPPASSLAGGRRI